MKSRMGLLVALAQNFKLYLENLPDAEIDALISQVEQLQEVLENEKDRRDLKNHLHHCIVCVHNGDLDEESPP